MISLLMPGLNQFTRQFLSSCMFLFGFSYFLTLGTLFYCVHNRYSSSCCPLFLLGQRLYLAMHLSLANQFFCACILNKQNEHNIIIYKDKPSHVLLCEIFACLLLHRQTDLSLTKLNVTNAILQVPPLRMMLQTSQPHSASWCPKRRSAWFQTWGSGSDLK